MKQNKFTNILLLVLIAAVIVAVIILNPKTKQPKGLPMPEGVEINDTVQARAMYVDSLSDLVHYNEKAFIVRKGVVDPKTKQFIKPPLLKILDENKKPIEKVKAIL